MLIKVTLFMTYRDLWPPFGVLIFYQTANYWAKVTKFSFHHSIFNTTISKSNFRFVFRYLCPISSFTYISDRARTSISRSFAFRYFDCQTCWCVWLALFAAQTICFDSGCTAHTSNYPCLYNHSPFYHHTSASILLYVTFIDMCFSLLQPFQTILAL